MILREILTEMRPYLGIQRELLIEQFLYKTQKEKKDSFIAHVSRFQHLKRELTTELGDREVTCVHCNGKWTEQNDFPDSVWSYLLKRSANLDADQRKQIWQWDSRELSTARLADFLVRLDRSEVLIAANLAGQAGKYTPAFHTQAGPLASGDNVVSESAEAIPSQPLVSAVALQSYLQSGTEPFAPSHGAVVDDDDEEYEVDSASDDQDYDMEAWDSDGQPLVDPNDPEEQYFNFDPQAENITEADAIALLAFGSMYRDSRKALAATRTGRDQKIVVKSKKFKTKKRAFVAKGKRSKVFKGKKPKFPKKQVTPFARFDKQGRRGTKKQMMEKVTCYRCGKKGHMSRNCHLPAPPVSKPSPVQSKQQHHLSEPVPAPVISEPLTVYSSAMECPIFNAFSRHVPPPPYPKMSGFCSSFSNSSSNKCTDPSGNCHCVTEASDATN